MGYCDSGCEHLTSRHNCKKYKKGLAYSSFSSKSLACSSHERCSECDKDHRIAELEEKQKQLLALIEEKQKIADALLLDGTEDDTDADGKMLLSELKDAIFKIVDALSDKNLLIKIYTFIKYLK